MSCAVIFYDARQKPTHISCFFFSIIKLKKPVINESILQLYFQPVASPGSSSDAKLCYCKLSFVDHWWGTLINCLVISTACKHRPAASWGQGPATQFCFFFHFEPRWTPRCQGFPATERIVLTVMTAASDLCFIDSHRSALLHRTSCHY